METSIQAEQIKFTLGEIYEVKLAFDEPKVFTGGKYGDSTMYGGTMGTKDIRFYASTGLHEEIQAQNLKRGSLCKIKKITKPGEDYTIFTVNGSNHKHSIIDENSNDTLTPPIEQNSNSGLEDLTHRVSELEKRIDVLDPKAVDEDIPF